MKNADVSEINLGVMLCKNWIWVERLVAVNPVSSSTDCKHPPVEVSLAGSDSLTEIQLLTLLADLTLDQGKP